MNLITFFKKNILCSFEENTHDQKSINKFIFSEDLQNKFSNLFIVLDKKIHEYTNIKKQKNKSSYNFFVWKFNSKKLIEIENECLTEITKIIIDYHNLINFLLIQNKNIKNNDYFIFESFKETIQEIIDKFLSVVEIQKKMLSSELTEKHIKNSFKEFSSHIEAFKKYTDTVNEIDYYIEDF